MNWIKIYEKPLDPRISGCRKVITESKDLKEEITKHHGTTILAYPIDEVAKAVSDPSARAKWVECMVKNYLIEGHSDNRKWLSYEAYNLQWPVNNQDYVFQQRLEQFLLYNKTTKTIKVSSVELHNYQNISNRVRGVLPTCVFNLSEINKKETSLEFIVKVDPKGEIPNFIKNRIQKGWSLRILRALNNYLKTTENRELAS